jgi:hypothetical protein
MKTQFKPCPFCGGKNLKIDTKSLVPRVVCFSRVQYPGGSEYCGAMGPAADIKGWNNRLGVADGIALEWESPR